MEKLLRRVPDPVVYVAGAVAAVSARLEDRASGVRRAAVKALATIAEKGVTILERGRTSTRWRDYVDIVALAEHSHEVFFVAAEVFSDGGRAAREGE